MPVSPRHCQAGCRWEMCGFRVYPATIQPAHLRADYFSVHSFERAPPRKPILGIVTEAIRKARSLREWWLLVSKQVLNKLESFWFSGGEIYNVNGFPMSFKWNKQLMKLCHQGQWLTNFRESPRIYAIRKYTGNTWLDRNLVRRNLL